MHERVGEVNGGFIASGITVSVFLALFPLILLVTAVVGYLAVDDPNVSKNIIDALGLTGSAAKSMSDAVDNASRARQAATVIGFLGLAWAATGVTTALQQGVRAPWQDRPQGVRDRLTGLAWLAGAGLLFLLSIALGGLLNYLPSQIPASVSAAALILIGLAVEVGLFLWTFWLLGGRRVPWRQLLPGAVLAGLGFEILKLVATVYVPHLVSRASALYGPLGIVFAVLAWLSILARLIVYSSALNAVLYERRRGTVVLEIKAPRLPGPTPSEADRGGIAVPPEPDPAQD
jgi:membrane protein